jgi:sulfate transport system permease protein
VSSAAWSIAKFEFRGKQLLINDVNRPALFGVTRGCWFDLRADFWRLKVGLVIGCLRTTSTLIFAVPGMVLATIFVTFPFVARELIPLMQAQGRDEEEAADSLGCVRLANLLVCDFA